MTSLPQNVTESVRRRNPHLYGQSSPQSQPEAKAKPLKRLRQSGKPLMNKLEKSFHISLICYYPPNAILAQSVTFRLGNGIRYTPDFFVFYEGRIFCYEVKGFFRDDAAVKLKVAAEKYPFICWTLVWKDEHKQWHQQTILP